MANEHQLEKDKENMKLDQVPLPDEATTMVEANWDSSTDAGKARMNHYESLTSRGETYIRSMSCCKRLMRTILNF
jgi:hypothetical protein